MFALIIRENNLDDTVVIGKALRRKHKGLERLRYSRARSAVRHLVQLLLKVLHNSLTYQFPDITRLRTIYTAGSDVPQTDFIHGTGFHVITHNKSHRCEHMLELQRYNTTMITRIFRTLGYQQILLFRYISRNLVLDIKIIGYAILR